MRPGTETTMIEMLSPGGAGLDIVPSQAYVTVAVLLRGFVLLEVAYLSALVVLLSFREAGNAPERWHGACRAPRPHGSLMAPGGSANPGESSVRSEDSGSYARARG